MSLKSGCICFHKSMHPILTDENTHMGVCGVKSLDIRGAPHTAERMQASGVDWVFTLALFLVSLVTFWTQFSCL